MTMKGFILTVGLALCTCQIGFSQNRTKVRTQTSTCIPYSGQGTNSFQYRPACPDLSAQALYVQSIQKDVQGNGKVAITGMVQNVGSID